MTTKVQLARKQGRTRLVRFRKKRKASRLANMAFRRVGQVAIQKVPAIQNSGWLAAASFGAELTDALIDLPWWVQPIVGTVTGAGDAAFGNRVGEYMP